MAPSLLTTDHGASANFEFIRFIEGRDTINTLITPIFRVMLLAGFVLAGVVILPSQADLAPTNRATAETLAGTIEDLDSLYLFVILRTEEEGERLVRFLAVADPTLMKGLVKGNRVVVEMDEHGVAKKILHSAAHLREAPNPKN